MKLALDPFMLRQLPFPEVTRLAAEIGYDYIEFSWREDFFPLFFAPRATTDRVRICKQALRETGVQISSMVALYRWASPDEDERRTAVRYWKRAIEVACEMECPVMNSEFGGSPETPLACEGAFMASLEELLPILERHGMVLHLEPHPGDFVEDNNVAVDMLGAIGSPCLKYLYCTPHTFHLGDDMASMIRYASPVLAHVHVADTFNHKASSGLRYIVNPTGTPVRVHQHLNMGEGEIDWDTFFRVLRDVGFDGIMTNSVFAWEDRAPESASFMLGRIRDYLKKWPPKVQP